jgi:hypothetical protein
LFDRAAKSERDERARQAGACALEESAHALGLGALGTDQAQMSANVVFVAEPSDLGFIGVGILVEASDAGLDGLAEAWTDLEALVAGAGGDHLEFLQAAGSCRQKIFSQRAKVLST